MTKIRWKACWMTSLMILIGILWSREIMPETKRLETELNANIASTITRLLKSLPSVWSIKREAKKIAATLADPEIVAAPPDSETIFAWIKELCQTPHRRPGTPEGHQAEEWVAGRFREMGLEQVTMDPIPVTVWTAKQWSLNVSGKNMIVSQS